MFKTKIATLRACYLGYVTQAIGLNFIPLLYIYLQKSYKITLSEIAIIPAFMFVIQIAIDLLSTKLIKRIGYRITTILAHVFATVGIAGMGFLPELLPNPYIGVLLMVLIFSAGCGFIEVVISPIVEACPTDEKSSSMGFLHSFYCWGQAGVILITTILFKHFGITMWRYISLFWALIPLFNAFLFTRVPIYTLEETGRGMSLLSLLKERYFWFGLVMMICAGACEIAVAQWSSAFAEAGLHVNKSVGDLAGPCAFAILMGISRLIYSFTTNIERLRKYMLFSAILCIVAYLMITCQPNAVVSLIGCAIAGFAVGAMWPGTYSIASDLVPKGGTEMFALFAFGGDIGCSAGVVWVGFFSDYFNGDIKIGILLASIFPIIMTITVALMMHLIKKGVSGSF